MPSIQGSHDSDIQNVYEETAEYRHSGLVLGARQLTMEMEDRVAEWVVVDSVPEWQ